MFKVKLSILIMLSFLLMIGCQHVLKSGIGDSREIYQPSAKEATENTKGHEESNKSIPEIKKENTNPKVEKATAEKLSKADVVQSVIAQPEPKPQKGEKLDFTQIDKLSNSKFGWGVGFNGKGVIPKILPSTSKLLEKYDGIYLGDTSKKVVYLTFDEGYENGYTPKILETLKENNVKALFFVTGPYIKARPDLVKRMIDEGHLIGNHSINHPSMPSLSNIALENEIYGLEKQFTAAFGKGLRYFRPPMGEYSARTLAATQQLGYKTIMWSFAYLDYDTKNQKGADYAYKMVMSNLHNGAIILLHAVSKDNAEALDSIIKAIRAEGYEIRAFDL